MTMIVSWEHNMNKMKCVTQNGCLEHESKTQLLQIYHRIRNDNGSEEKFPRICS